MTGTLREHYNDVIFEVESRKLKVEKWGAEFRVLIWGLGFGIWDLRECEP